MNEQQSTDELLNSLESQAAELETTPEQQAEAEQAENQQLAEIAESEAAAGMMTGVIETALKFIYPFVEITNEMREQAQAVLAPLIEKYGVSYGGRWAAEINALSFFGMTGFGIYQQIQFHKAQEAVKSQQSQESTAGTHGEKSQHFTA